MARRNGKRNQRFTCTNKGLKMLRIHGDSLGAGVGASSPANSYASLLAAQLSMTLSNASVTGDMAADQCVSAKMLAALSASDRCLIELGTNDFSYCQGDAIKTAFDNMAFRSLIAWHALPTRVTARDASVVSTGTWQNDDYSVGIGSWSNSVGSSKTFTVSGTSIYIGLKFYNGAFGNANILVDGNLVQSFSSQSTGAVTKNARFPYDPDGCIRIGGLSSGVHSVQVVVTAPTSSPGVVYVQWVAGSDQPVGPKVVVSNAHHWTAAGYASTSPAANASLIDNGNAILSSMVAEFVSDGANVALANLCSVINPAIHVGADGIHFNDAGHAVAASLYYTTFVGLPSVTQVSTYLGSDGNFYIGDGAARRRLALV